MNTLEYYDSKINLLQGERNAITKTGHITPEQGLRLIEIDEELKLWFKYQDLFMKLEPSSQPAARPSS